MTIQRARELLGEEIEHLSDAEVAQLNDQIKSMCKALITIIVQNHRGEKPNEGLLTNEGKE